MNTRVKVPRLVLIERIKEAIVKGEAEHEAEMEVYRKKLAKITPLALKEITDLAAKVSAMSDEELTQFIIDTAGRYSSFAYTFEVRLPSPPYPYNSEYDERMLRILQASTDETISVSTRDGLYQYL